MLSLPGYRIIREIAVTGMSVVYHAEQLNLGREVALKQLHRHHTGNEDRRQRFYNEARLMAKLVHPNIVQLFDLLELQDGSLVLVMEYVEGKDLDRLIGTEKGPFPWEAALPVFFQILKGVGHAHAGGVVHRDIKPSNVILSTAHVAKVNDFGVAKLMDNEGMTKVGTQIGTPAYMSPEQVMGGDAGVLSDIYSLGITLYEMLAGHLPFPDHITGEWALQQAIMKADLPDPREYYPQIPEWLVRVVFKAVKRKPEDRFSSCDEFHEQLAMGIETGKVFVKGRTRLSLPQFLWPGKNGRTAGSVSDDSYRDRLDREARKRQQLQDLMDRANRKAEPQKVPSHQVTQLIGEEEQRELAKQKLAMEIEELAEERLKRKQEEAKPPVPVEVAFPLPIEESVETAHEEEPRAQEQKRGWLKPVIAASIIVALAVPGAFLAGVFKGAENGNVEAGEQALEPAILQEPDLVLLEQVPFPEGYIPSSHGQGRDFVLLSDQSIMCASEDQLIRIPASNGEPGDSTIRSDYPRGLSSVYDMIQMPQGHLLLSDIDANRIVAIDPDGMSVISTIGGFSPQGPYDLSPLGMSSFSGINNYFNNSTMEYGFDICAWLDGNEAEEVFFSSSRFLYSREASVDYYRFFIQVPLVASSSHGFMYMSQYSSDECRFDIYNGTGEYLRSVELEYLPVAKESSQILDERISYHNTMNAPEGDWVADPYRRAITRLGVDSGGLLWVTVSTEDGAVYEVFDSTGVHVRTVTRPQDSPDDMVLHVTEIGFIGISPSESCFYRYDFRNLDQQP